MTNTYIESDKITDLDDVSGYEITIEKIASIQFYILHSIGK